MKINEVEQAIGMTKKNIRFYEQEGLLTPSRSPGNGYRDYSAEDVDTLRQIKLLRKLGISIEDIKKLQNDSLTLEDCLKQHLIVLEEERKNLDAVTKFCRRLLATDATLESLPAEQLLIDMENMEEEGTRFMNAKNRNENEENGFSFLTVMLVAIILPAIVTAFIIGRKSAPNDQMSQNAVLYSFYENGDFFYNLKGDVYEPADQVRTYWYDHSADSSLIAYWLYEEDLGNPRGYRTDLYYITKDLEPVKVAESVLDYMVSFNGSYIAYFQSFDNNSLYDLYLYEVSSGKSTKIDEDVSSAYFCLSPNGKIIAYQNYGTLYVGGLDMEVSEVARDDIRPSGVVPVAVSDDGAYLYYIFNGDLYYYNVNEKNSVQVAPNIDPLNLYANFFCFNRDLSEMIYVVDFETYYYTPELDAPVKIADDRLYRVLSNSSAAETYHCSAYAEIAGVDTLKGHVLEGYLSRLYWLNEDAANAVEIAADYNDHMLSADGKSLLYLEDGILYRLDSFGEEMSPTVVCEKDNIQYFTANSDLSKIYISTARDLYYVKNREETEQLSDHLAYVEYEEYGYYEYYPVYDNASEKIYFLEDDTLCQADKTQNSKKLIAEDVTQLELLPGGISYLCNKDDKPVRYYLHNGEATELFTE